MTTTLARRLARFTLFAAVAAAGVSVGAAHLGAPAVRIIELPRVTIVAKRAKVGPVVGATNAITTMPVVRTTTPPRVELAPAVRVAKHTPASTTLMAERKLQPAGV